MPEIGDKRSTVAAIAKYWREENMKDGGRERIYKNGGR